MNKTYLGQKGRRLAMAFAVATSSLVSVAVASSSSSVSAADPIQVIAPTLKKEYAENRNEWVPAFEVKNLTPNNLAVSISFAEAPQGTTFSVDQRLNLTLKFGYFSWRHVTSVAFTGKTRDVNRALASLKLHSTSGGKVTFKVTATADDTQLVYEPVSSHYYGFVSAPHIKWTEALAAASALSFRGVPGYLAAINSEVENEFISYNIENAANVWIAATDKDAEGDFKWVTGEDAGKTFWKARCAAAMGADSCTGANSVDAQGTYKTTNIDNPLVNTYSSWDRGVGRWGQNYEPNNWSGNENYVVTNWDGSVGRWNDLKDTDTSNIAGYVVEYAEKPGKLFTGVVEAKASFNVIKTPSTFAPTSVGVAKFLGGVGAVRIAWKAPTSVAKGLFAAKLKGYYVTTVSRPGEKFCADSESQKKKSCVIYGFLPSDTLAFTVNAEYTKSPTGGLLGRGQKVFGAGEETTPFDFVMAMRIETAIGRPVAKDAKVFVQQSNLKAGSTFTVKANGVLVAMGIVGADGSIPKNKYFTFPTSKIGADWTTYKTLYTLDAVNADGSAFTQSVGMLFNRVYYMSSRLITAEGLSWFNSVPYTVIPHTAIAS